MRNKETVALAVLEGRCRVSRDVMEEMCSGLPYADGFCWSEVEYFQYEDGVWEPYRGLGILPGPALRLSATVSPNPWITEHDGE